MTPPPFPHKEHRLPKKFWLLVTVLWLPFPCLFVPFTLMREDSDPWYIVYTTPLSLLGMSFYQPANLVTTAPLILGGHHPSIPLLRVAAFIQSALLSALLWRSYASRLAGFPQQVWSRLVAGFFLLGAVALILFGISLLLSPSRDQPPLSYIGGGALVFLGVRAGYRGVICLRPNDSPTKGA